MSDLHSRSVDTSTKKQSPRGESPSTKLLSPIRDQAKGSWRGPFSFNLSRPAHGRIGRLLTVADILQRLGAGPVEARIISRGFNIS
jgi:hypothetical protein